MKSPRRVRLGLERHYEEIERAVFIEAGIRGVGTKAAWQRVGGRLSERANRVMGIGTHYIDGPNTDPNTKSWCEYSLRDAELLRTAFNDYASPEIKSEIEKAHENAFFALEKIKGEEFSRDLMRHAIEQYASLVASPDKPSRGKANWVRDELKKKLIVWSGIRSIEECTEDDRGHLEILKKGDFQTKVLDHVIGSIEEATAEQEFACG